MEALMVTSNQHGSLLIGVYIDNQYMYKFSKGVIFKNTKA
jgi:hypothetical protein